MNGPEVRRNPETGNVAIHLFPDVPERQWLEVFELYERVQVQLLPPAAVQDWTKLEETTWMT